MRDNVAAADRPAAAVPGGLRRLVARARSRGFRRASLTPGARGPLVVLGLPDVRATAPVDGGRGWVDRTAAALEAAGVHAEVRVAGGPGDVGTILTEVLDGSARRVLLADPRDDLVPQALARALRPRLPARGVRYLGIVDGDDPWVRRAPGAGPAAETTLLGVLVDSAVVQAVMGDARLLADPATHPDLAVRWESVAGTVERVDTPAYRVGVREADRPVPSRARFRSADLAERLAALDSVAETLAPDRVRTWTASLVTGVVVPLARDAVAAGPEQLAVLGAWAARVRDVLRDGGSSTEVPAAARVTLEVLAAGDVDAVARWLGHLAANPHGLPTVDGSGELLVLPDHLEVDPSCRRIAEVERTPRVRVADQRVEGEQLVVDLLAIRLYGPALVPARVVLRNDDAETELAFGPTAVRGAEEWAARTWEDHADAGLRVAVPAGAWGPGAGVLEVQWPDGVTSAVLGRDPLTTPDVRRHVTPAGLVEVCWGPRGLTVGPASAPEPPSSSPTVEDVSATPDALVLQVRVPGTTTCRLVGPDGGACGPRVEAHPAGPPVTEVRLPLVDLEGLPLASGRYRLVSDGGPDGAEPVGWGTRARHTLSAVGPDLVVGSARVRGAGAPGDGVDLVVSTAVPAADRGPRAQQHARRRAAAGERRDRTVLLESFRGRSVADNPGAVGRELVRRSAAEDLGLDLAWVVDDPGVVTPPGTRAVVRRSSAWHDLMLNARAYVANAAAPYAWAKQPGRYHLQTWHGTPLKRLGEDRGMGDFDTWWHRHHVRRQAAEWDLLLSTSASCTEAFRTAFAYGGPVLEVGQPRNDQLVAPEAAEVRRRTRAALGVEPGRPVVLYAPTWRDARHGTGEVAPRFLDARELARLLPDCVVWTRGHYNVGADDRWAGGGLDRVRDVSAHPEIAELFLACDVLVTDYSSVLFDFSVTGKPMAFLCPDLDHYRDVERGFYLDFEQEAPGPVVTSTEELADALGGLLGGGPGDDWASARERFRATYCPHEDGRSAQRVVDRLLAEW